jgi:hypothetical protein
VIFLMQGWADFVDWLGGGPAAQALAASVTLLVTVALAAITFSYAVAARRQADASVKMAEEMREQRRDAVRPLMDIEPAPVTGDEGLERALRRGLPPFIRCRLRNIGVGPALNVKFDVYDESRSAVVTKGVAAVAPGAHAQEWFTKRPTEEWPLAVEADSEAGQGAGVLRVQYEDVFGNALQSLREVVPGEKLGPFGDVGPLKAPGA